MLGSIILLVGSIGGGTNYLTLVLGIVLFLIGLLHWGDLFRVFSIPGIILASVALLLATSALFRTWGIAIPYIEARTGIGPYLSIVGSATALYGSSRVKGKNWRASRRPWDDGEERYTPEDIIWR